MRCRESDPDLPPESAWDPPLPDPGEAVAVGTLAEAADDGDTCEHTVLLPVQPATHGTHAARLRREGAHLEARPRQQRGTPGRRLGPRSADTHAPASPHQPATASPGKASERPGVQGEAEAQASRSRRDPGGCVYSMERTRGRGAHGPHRGPGWAERISTGQLSAGCFWGVIGARPTSPSPEQKRRCAGPCKPVHGHGCAGQGGGRRPAMSCPDPTRTRGPSPHPGLGLTQGRSPRRPPGQHAVGILPVHRLLQNQPLDRL